MGPTYRRTDLMKCRDRVTAELLTMDDPRLAKFTKTFIQADIERRVADVDKIVAVLDKAGRTEVDCRDFKALSDAALKRPV